MLKEIRLAEKNDTSMIVELLNTVTLNLHEKHINQWTYPWDFKEIDIAIKNKNTYMLIIDDLIVGTFSLKDVGTNSWLPTIKPNNLYLYRIAILPKYQGRNIGQQIINYACQTSRDFKKILYLDCWAGNENLKNFYVKAGLDYCGDFLEEDYMISVFKHE